MDGLSDNLLRAKSCFGPVSNRFYISHRGSIIGAGGEIPPKGEKKEKMRKYGVFPCMGVIKISYSVIFNREICTLRGLIS